MKRKTADRLWWQRVTERRFHVDQISTPAFSGCITLLQIDAVRDPLWVTIGSDRICIADAGYAWLQHFPDGSRHTLTTMFDPHGRIVQWYIDICAGHGIGSDGVPWFDDLYLDLVIAPPRTLEVIDQDELDGARDGGAISAAEHALAWHEARRLIDLIERDAFPLLNESAAHYARMMRRASVTSGD